MRGRFITFEGGEGTGKSTHATLLADRLKSAGIGVILTREPGGSPGAEVIRHVLLSGVAKPLGVQAEALLPAAITCERPSSRRWRRAPGLSAIDLSIPHESTKAPSAALIRFSSARLNA